jgi:hypothetical protein
MYADFIIHPPVSLIYRYKSIIFHGAIDYFSEGYQSIFILLFPFVVGEVVDNAFAEIIGWLFSSQ